MKKILHAVVAAFSTFSVIPMPRIGWDPDSFRGLLGALPLVGAAIGGICCLYFWLAGLLNLPVVLSAAALTLLPLAVSGGIHMDGFADTVDALKSYGDPEKKREILKDPHTGAFAVMGIAAYLILYFALCGALPMTWKMLLLLGLTHVIARVTGAAASILLPMASHKGMLHTFREASTTGNIVALAVGALLSLTGAAFLMPLAAALFLAASLCVFFYVKRIARKQFGGMSGDLAGFCISVTEIALLFVLVLSERMVALWF
nr:adenosylcobinamide-GDP ribazoletransferase [Lachnospiraceae bacterium]